MSAWLQTGKAGVEINDEVAELVRDGEPWQKE